MIYFAREEGSRFVKIGHCTGSLDERVQILQVGNPRQLTIAASCTGTERDEWGMHQRFASSRVRGEWFESTDELAALIESIGVGPCREIPTPRSRLDLRRQQLRSIIKSRRGAIADLSKEVGISARNVGLFLDGGIRYSHRLEAAAEIKARQILESEFIDEVLGGRL